MKPAVQISEAESAVMNVLWQRSPLATDDIVASLSDRAWQASTIKTLLNRLLKKGAIKAQKDGRRFLYSPAMKRERWLIHESTSLLDRVFGGRVAPLVAHFSRSRKLSKRDLEELKQLIKELDNER